MTLRLRLALLVVAATSVVGLGAGALAAPASASQLIDRNASAIHAGREQQRRGADHVPRGREAQARAGLERRQRDRADAASRQVVVQARLRGRLGQVPPRLLEDVRQRVPVATAGRRSPGRSTVCTAPTARTGRSRRGSGRFPTSGSRPTATQSAWELRLSHWTGALPVLSTSRSTGPTSASTTSSARSPTPAQSVYGFRSTSSGAPARQLRPEHLPRHVRLGLRHGLEAREQLPDAQASGAFCYGFYPHGRHPAGNGASYRATVEGPRRDARRHVAGSAAPGPYRPDRAAGRER